MLKHTLAVILLSILVLLAMPQAQVALHGLLAAHDWIAESLKQVFSSGRAGNLTRELISLLVIPFLVAMLPTAIYWLLRRNWLSCFVDIVWITWLIQTAALIVLYAPGK